MVRLREVVQSNARFNALDKLVVVVHSVAMPVGFGRVAIKTKGRQLAVLAQLKRSIVEVRAEKNCLAHALIISIAKFDKDPNYDSYRHGFRIIPLVNHLLQTTGIDLTNGGGIRELLQFQEHFKDYRIVVYGGLNCEDMIFDGQSQSQKRIYLHCDETTRHYHVITNLTGAMAKRNVCEGCGNGCERGRIHKCDESCSNCMFTSPCAAATVAVRIPCESCNRTFRSQACFDRHKTNKLSRKTVCEQKRNCAICGSLLTCKKNECFKPFCPNYAK